MLTLVLTVVLVALIFEYINGFHDTANSTATVPPRFASAPDTISVTHSRLTAPWVSNVCGWTPSSACLAS